ncbi:MAG: TolC family protein [Alphaproteobacteria bacterium]|nr:TolC family protein [Alphaproteobacteria bacterium]
MHRQKRYISTILCYFLICNGEALATNLSDAIVTAQSNNRNIKLEQIRLNSVKTEKTKAIAEFLPNVSANVSYGQRNSFYQGQTYDRSTKQKTEEMKLEQPIFDGLHSVSKYREANYKIKSGSARKSDKIQEISFAAVQSYCNLFRYQELIKLQEENKRLGKKFLDLVKRRKDVRIIDKADIIKFTYETSLTEEKYFDALNRLNKAKFDYQNVVGELHENLTEPKIPLAEIAEEEFSKDKVLESALTNNHNIKSYHYSYLASKAAYNAEKSNFLPKVSLTASSSKQDKVVYLNNQDLNQQTVFLNVSVPIFQKGVEYANVSKAGYDRDAAKEEYEITRDNVIKEVNQALEEYRFFSEMNKTNKKLFELAKNRAEIFTKRSNSKVEDPIEVIRVKIEANDRKINYIDSQMDLVITHYKIKYFLGEI